MSQQEERSVDPNDAVTPLERLAAHLQSSTLEAAFIDPALRTKIAEQELGMSITDIGRMEIEARRTATTFGPTDPVQALTAQMSAQEQRQLEPYRKRLQQLSLRRKRYMSMTAAELKKIAVDMAKDNQTSPTESIILWTALYADEAERRFIAALILLESDSERLPQYNYNIASKKGEIFLTQYGAELAHFQLPLFPEDHEYDLQNQKLLRISQGQEPSGGSKPTTRPTVFRCNRGDDDLLGAGPTLPVAQNPQTNQWEADATLVQKAFDDAFAQIRFLSTKVDTMSKESAKTPDKEKTPIEKQLSSLTSAVRELRRAMTSAQNTALRYRSRPRGPRGGEASDELDF